MSRLVEIVDIMTRSNHVSATEGQCVIASVIIHSELEKPTKEFGSSMLEEAKSLVQPIIVRTENEPWVSKAHSIYDLGWTDHKQKIFNTLMNERREIHKRRKK